MPAFRTLSGIPYSKVNLVKPEKPLSTMPMYSVTAEVTGLQLEFRDLSKCVGDPKYEVSQRLLLYQRNLLLVP
jgi:hypothetical protein